MHNRPLLVAAVVVLAGAGGYYWYTRAAPGAPVPRAQGTPATRPAPAPTAVAPTVVAPTAVAATAVAATAGPPSTSAAARRAALVRGDYTVRPRPPFNPTGSKSYKGWDMSAPFTGVARTGHLVAVDARDPLLAPTRVTLKVRDAHAYDAFQQLIAQTGYSIRMEPGEFWETLDFPKITTDLTNAPLLEAVLEVCSQANLGIFRDSPLTLSPAPISAFHGPWCISGPFAFVATPMGTAQRPWLRLRAHADPACLVLEAPKELKDLVAEGAEVQAAPAVGDTGDWALTFAGQPPARLGRLGAKATFLIASQSELLEIPGNERDAKTKRVAGLTITAGPWRRDPAAIYDGPITIARDTMAPEQWQALLPHLAKTRIDFCDTEDRPYTPYHRQVKTAADGQSITLTPSYWRNGPRSDFQNRIAYFSIEVPLAVKRVTVPVDLRDVPLWRQAPSTAPTGSGPAR